MCQLMSDGREACVIPNDGHVRAQVNRIHYPGWSPKGRCYTVWYGLARSSTNTIGKIINYQNAELVGVNPAVTIRIEWLEIELHGLEHFQFDVGQLLLPNEIWVS